MMQKQWAILLIIGFFNLSGQLLPAQEVLALTGSWTRDIGLADLTGGAGSDLNSQYTSDANVVTANITRTGYNLFTNWRWQVTVQKSNINWDSHLLLDVQRSSDGLGLGTIQYGTTFQELTSVAANFFQGTRHRYWIGFQYRLRGVSAIIPAQSYTCDVIYTVYEY